MPDDAAALLERARRQVPTDAEARDCWPLLLRGIELGWLDAEALEELIGHLSAGNEYGTEELLFTLCGDTYGDRLRVSFLDEHAECSPAAMLAALSSLARCSSFQETREPHLSLTPS